mgnify:CR=1 FL=1
MGTTVVMILAGRPDERVSAAFRHPDTLLNFDAGRVQIFAFREMSGAPDARTLVEMELLSKRYPDDDFRFTLVGDEIDTRSMLARNGTLTPVDRLYGDPLVSSAASPVAATVHPPPD